MKWSETFWGKTVLAVVVAVELLVAAVVVAAWALPGVEVTAFAVAGGSVCPMNDLMKCRVKRGQWFEAIDEIRAKARLVEQDAAGYERWETPYGSWWIPEASGGSLPAMLAQQAVDLYGDGVHTVQAGDVVLDGGAHVGFWVREALDRGAQTVVAIEPAPANLECLRRNLRDEIEQGRVIVYPKGIWDVPDVLPLWEDPDNSGADGFILKEGDFEAHHVIPLVPVDQLVEELGLKRVDVIKMDIKGAVERALKGASETIKRDHPKLIIAADEQEADNPVRIQALVVDLAPGYGLACEGCEVLDDWSVSPDVMLMSYR